MINSFFCNEYRYVDRLQEFLYKEYIPETWSFILRDIILLAGLFILCTVAYYITRLIIRQLGKRIIKKTSTLWDDRLFANKFFKRLSFLVPAVLFIKLLPFAIPYYEGWIDFGIALGKIYIVVIVLLTIFSVLSTFNDIYDTWEIAKYKPIKGYIQLVKVILLGIVIVLIIAIVFNQSPLYLLTGLGALSAVLLLIFKDALLGLVAGIQLSANDMARPGDWITMPKYNADGDVEEITLTTVKVRNFDKTLVYIPSYALISDSFINWRGMLEAEGRRIKRALNIDLNCVKFCTNEMLEELKKIDLIREYIENKQTEIEQFNLQTSGKNALSSNRRHQTNLGIFRAYMEAYLRSLPVINRDAILMVRQLPPSDKGIPLELYAFSVSKEWITYEKNQADIFDHLIAVLPVFWLKLYQTPTGNDIQAVIAQGLSQPD
jgi:miniconductance mechanosensitive channel